jgi:hypothetical protein
MQPDLPETYYLDNVVTLFEHVRRVYADILDIEQLSFLEGFAELSDDASKLCIRLLNRSHDCYRRSKLNYREIDSLDGAIAELRQRGFIELQGELDRGELLRLYTLPELRAHLGAEPGSPATAKLRRGELEAYLLEHGDATYFQRLRQADDLLQLRCRDQYQLCQMLFFGNLNQSMTDFVLNDLGLYQYESYPVDPQHRPYRNAAEIQQHWLLYQLQTLFELSDSSDPAQLRELWQLIPTDIDQQAPGFRKSEQLRYQIARQLERLADLEAASKLYRQCLLPPSRERRARIFALRLCKRHGYATPDQAEQLRITHRPEIVELELDYQDSVEIAVAGHYNEADADGVCRYVENSLFNGVLGLLLWDVIFAPLPGAFYNAFQYRPSDFYAHDFCARRKQLLDATWKSINNNADIWHIVERRWQQKHGLMNPLVNWQGLDLELIQLALERIDHAHWRAVFGRILQDLRNNRAGFPDLVQFPAAGGYRLIEVKGPGDSLQKNQQRWMQFFAEQGIPHQLDKVTWRQR